ncbi:MAG: hypothetical protein O3B31_01315 [Chloroflexi bacterium]|nr:hypothetical protein [Chloroflexota bacterium]
MDPGSGDGGSGVPAQHRDRRGRPCALAGERGYVDAAAVEAGVECAEAAASDLPRADRLGSIISAATRSGRPVDLNALADEDYVEDFLQITRVDAL